MNMSFKVGGLAYRLRFKAKKIKKIAIIVTTQHIRDQFLSSLFLSCSIANMVVV
jgi:hypothetical protein